MKQIEAAKRSMILAENYSECFQIAPDDCGIDHLRDMLKTMETGEMSEGKLGRWLGWMQASIVFACDPYVTLEHMKSINRECA